MHLLTFIENIYFDALSEHYIIIYEIYATKDYLLAELTTVFWTI